MACGLCNLVRRMAARNGDMSFEALCGPCAEAQKIAQYTTERATQTDLGGEQANDSRVVAGKCFCGGYMNDWHSHASDCIIINNHGKDYAQA